MQAESGHVRSDHLSQSMEYLWFGSKGRLLVMLPTSGGRYTENRDFGMVDILESEIDAGRLQVCCVDSINPQSWADPTLPPWEKLWRHRFYDRFLKDEFFPIAAERAGRSDPILYGASLGGWQAATFAARHPEQIGRVVAFSGFFDLRRLLKDWWGDDAYYFSPVDFISNMDAEWVARLSQVDWVVATGETDSLVQETRNFALVLRQKGIPVLEEVWPGVFGHDWSFWKEHLPRFVP